MNGSMPMVLIWDSSAAEEPCVPAISSGSDDSSRAPAEGASLASEGSRVDEDDCGVPEDSGVEDSVVAGVVVSEASDVASCTNADRESLVALAVPLGPSVSSPHAIELGATPALRVNPSRAPTSNVRFRRLVALADRTLVRSTDIDFPSSWRFLRNVQVDFRQEVPLEANWKRIDHPLPSSIHLFSPVFTRSRAEVPENPC